MTTFFIINDNDNKEPKTMPDWLREGVNYLQPKQRKQQTQKKKTTNPSDAFLQYTK